MSEAADLLQQGQALLDQGDDRAALAAFDKAARAGHPMGMNMVGRCIEFGRGANADKALAARWYRAAAEYGLDWGMYNLATLLALGDGVPMDRAEAFQLFGRAAALGHVKSMNMLGSFHEDGWAGPVDLSRAAGLYRLAAEGGDFRGMFNHARMLLEAGHPDEACRWLEKLPESANQAFLAKVRNWLNERPEEALRTLAAEFAQGVA